MVNGEPCTAAHRFGSYNLNTLWDLKASGRNMKLVSAATARAAC